MPPNVPPLDAGPKRRPVGRGLAASGCYATALSFFLSFFRSGLAVKHKRPPIKWLLSVIGIIYAVTVRPNKQAVGVPRGACEWGIEYHGVNQSVPIAQMGVIYYLPLKVELNRSSDEGPLGDWNIGDNRFNKANASIGLPSRKHLSRQQWNLPSSNWLRSEKRRDKWSYVAAVFVAGNHNRPTSEILESNFNPIGRRIVMSTGDYEPATLSFDVGVRAALSLFRGFSGLHKSVVGGFSGLLKKGFLLSGNPEEQAREGRHENGRKSRKPFRLQPIHLSLTALVGLSIAIPIMYVVSEIQSHRRKRAENNGQKENARQDKKDVDQCVTHSFYRSKRLVNDGRE
jgi:hypothetical protein